MNPIFRHLNRGDRLVLLLFVFLLIGGSLLFFYTPSQQAQALVVRGDSTIVFQDTLSNTFSQENSSSSADTKAPPLELNEEYVGPPKHLNYTPKRYLPAGVTLDLNSVDSATLTQVAGIGPAFARRIVRYRERLGGYYTILQLQEVYGMTTERYAQIKSSFVLASQPKRIPLDSLAYDNLPSHPYLNHIQRNAIARILYRDGKIEGWSQLQMLDEFSREDSIRLCHYFIF